MANPPASPGRLFANPQPGPDETAFQVDNTSAEYYRSPYYKLHKNEIQPVPAPRVSPPRMDLGEVLGAEALQKIAAAGKIVFHAVGDTGAAKVNIHQGPAKAIEHEGWVADAMARDVQAGGPDAPSFFFHLGDVIYNFGEAEYYYDQFYEPFRAYDAPIFAIPGNHDGGVQYGADATTPLRPTLMGFLRNFCTSAPGPSPDAAGMVRSTMTQPGVYFSLDAPFVTIVGLYSNVLEEFGVISSQGGRYPIGDDQLHFLAGELERVKALPDRQQGKRAVIVACHHPPASVDGKHGGTTGLSADIDSACREAGLWPDAVLSGHAHLYQRFTRLTSDERKIPYVVSGSGGFAATPPVEHLAPPPVTKGEFTREIAPIVEFGYLTVTVEATQTPATLTIAYRSSDGRQTHDEVSVAIGS